MIRRAKHFGFTPLVATTLLKEDDAIEKIADGEGCWLYRGEADDKLLRWLKACDYYGVDKFVTLDGDDLFFDPDYAYRGLSCLEAGEDFEPFDIIYPPFNAYIGSFSFALTRDIVERACEIKDSDKTEMMWHFIKKVPDVKSIHLCVEYGLSQRPFRLTLDYPEDYCLLNTVRRILGNLTKRDRIEDLFYANPNLRDVNWFRQKEMEKGQEVGGSGLF